MILCDMDMDRRLIHSYLVKKKKGLRLSTAFMAPENFHSTLKGPLSSARIERIAALAHSNLAQKTPVPQSS